MLRPRLIPALLVHNGGLVKTVRFGDPKYVGDPLNAVRIFNEKQVDELIVLDIDNTVMRRDPDLRLIARLAEECRMPLCYGGGVRTVDQIERIIALGVEKVALASAIGLDPSVIANAARRVGSQSVVAVLDVKMVGDGYEVFTHNGSVSMRRDPMTLAAQCSDAGAGEILVNAIDRDGTQEGYDLELAARLRDSVTAPITFLGGAGSLQHVRSLVDRVGVAGAAAGSLFVFKGKRRAVLINYPRPEEKLALFGIQVPA